MCGNVSCQFIAFPDIVHYYFWLTSRVGYINTATAMFLFCEINTTSQALTHCFKSMSAISVHPRFEFQLGHIRGVFSY